MSQSPPRTHPVEHRPTSAVKEGVLVFLLAILLHGLAAWLTGEATGSFDKYTSAAHASLDDRLAPERYVDLSPLYLELHEGVQRLLSSGDPVASGRIVVWLQLLSVGLASLFLWGLLRRRGVERRLRLLALSAFVLNPSYLIYSSIAEPETILVLLVMALLVASERLFDGSSPFWAGVAGCLCLLCVLTRPTLLSAVILVPIALVVAPRKLTGSRLLLGVLFVLPVVLGQTALALRNHSLTGELTVRVMNPGTVFYEGNNPVTWGSSAAYPPAMFRVDANAYPGEVDWAHVAYRDFARVSVGSIDESSLERRRPLPVSRVNEFWLERARNFVVDHPGRALRLAISKAGAILRGPIEHDVANAWRKLEAMPWFVPRFPFALLSCSALLGVVIVFRQLRERPMAWIELGLVGSQFIAMVVFYVSARQRLTALPLVVLLAVALWRELLGSSPGSQQESSGAEGSGFFFLRRRTVATMVFLSAGLLSLPGERYLERRSVVLALEAASSLAHSAQLALGEGQFNDARELTLRAATLVPEAIDRLRPAGLDFSDDGRGLAVHAFELEAGAFDEAPPYRKFDLALLASRAGQVEEARRRWQVLVDSGKRFHRGGAISSSPLVHLAELEAQTGNFEASRPLLTRALQTWPGEPFALARLASFGDLDALGRLNRYYDRVSVTLLLAEAQCALGRDQSVATATRSLAEELPRLRRAWILLAACVEPDSALARGDYWRAMELQAEPVVFEDRIVELFEPSEHETEDSDLALQRVQVLRQFGRIEEALSVLPTRAEMAPGLEAVWEFERQQLLFARGR